MICGCSRNPLLWRASIFNSTIPAMGKPPQLTISLVSFRLLSSHEINSPQPLPHQTPPESSTKVPSTPLPKLHWTEEFKIRSPKVPASRLQSEPVVAIDIESDAYADRRIAFYLRRTPLGGPLNAKIRGVGKILSWCAVGFLPYLLFCKWAGGTPLLGEMTTFAVPAGVVGASLGYLGLNLALERAVLRRRIYSVALDEVDPSLVYITTLPVGGWLHGSYRTFATRLDNLQVDSTGRNWARLRFKTGTLSGAPDWLSLPIRGAKLCIADERAMAAFADACFGRVDSEGVKGASNLRGFERAVLPSDAEIDRHLETTLREDCGSSSSGSGPEETVELPEQSRKQSSKA